MELYWPLYIDAIIHEIVIQSTISFKLMKLRKKVNSFE